MSKTIKILEYLNSKEFGKFYDVNEFLESIDLIKDESKIEFLQNLSDKSYIEYLGGNVIDSFMNPSNEKIIFKAKILTNGEDYLMENSKNNKQDGGISIIGNVEGSQIGFDLTGASNANIVNQTPKQNEPAKKTIWSNIPEWAKILGGIGAIAGLVKTIIELNKP